MPKVRAYRFFSGTNYDVAGKTGTAQVFGLKQNEKYDHDSVAKHLRDHSLFIGFAPPKSENCYCGFNWRIKKPVLCSPQSD